MRSESIVGSFFNSFVYSICRALSEEQGKPRAEEILSRFGELLLEEIERGQNLPYTDALTTLRIIAEYLVVSGYMAKIEVEDIEEDVYIINMYGGPAHDSSQRLIAEGYAPSHVLTNTMFAALAKMNLEAVLEHLDVSDPLNTRERWQLVEKT